MKIFQKLKNLLSRIFFGKKKDIVEDESSEDHKQKEEIKDENVEVIEEKNNEEATPVFACFTDEDKDGIVDILRPIIKGFNSDALYVNICELLEESKVLKTFASLSDDKTTLTINMTQNSLFNNKIGEYIAEHVESIFQSTIDANVFGKFVVSADSDKGSIEIKKIG